MNLHGKFHAFATATVTVAQGSTDTIATYDVRGYERIFVTLDVAGFSLDAFAIKARAMSAGAYQTLYSTTTHFTAPSGILVGVSSDLSLLAVGAGWFILDVLGLESVQIAASSSDAAGSTVIAYTGGI